MERQPAGCAAEEGGGEITLCGKITERLMERYYL